MRRRNRHRIVVHVFDTPEGDGLDDDMSICVEKSSKRAAVVFHASAIEIWDPYGSGNWLACASCGQSTDGYRHTTH